MRFRHRDLILSALAVLAAMFAPGRAQCALATALIDRKFPTFSFCPIESRGANLVAFVAPANGSVRVTFAADNFFPQFDGGPLVYNEPRIDNIVVMPRSTWEANQTVCSDDCFFENGNLDAAPTFRSDPASVAGLPYVEFFDSNPFTAPSPVWAGGSWDTDRTAPRDDDSGTYCGFASAGGSLLLGTADQGSVSVSSTVSVLGLQPAVEYVVVGWFFVRSTVQCGSGSCWAQLSIIVDEDTSVPSDASTWGAMKALYGTDR